MKDTQPSRFNLVVTHRDPKSGRVEKKDPYILRVCGEAGSSEKAQLWERPAGSGNLFDKSNNPIGRWEYEEKTVKGKTHKIGKFVEGAKHIEWNPPVTEDVRVARENAALKAELAALKAEKDKTAAKTPAKKE